jgi:tyrosyl-tRNA synthetase
MHGVDAAMKAREEFTARFSKRSFGDVEDLPAVSDLGQSVTELVRGLGFAASNGEVRRVAQQNGLRVVVEADGGQEQVTLTADDIREPLATLLKDKVEGQLGAQAGDYYLKVGRKLARIVR